MKKTSHPQVMQARQLFQEGEHQGALNILQSLEAENLSVADEAEVCLIKGGSLVLLGQYDHEYLDLAIDYYKLTSSHIEFGMAKLYKGFQLRATGDFISVKETLSESYAAFSRVSEHVWAARAVNLMAHVFHVQGDMLRATQSWEDCIRCHIRAGNEKGVVVTRNNLAVTLYRVGRLSDSEGAYQESSRSLELLNKQNMAIYYMGRAMLKALRKDANSCLGFLKDAEELVAGFMREKALLFEYKGAISLHFSEYEKAKSSLRDGLELAYEIAPDSDLVSQIKRLLGDLYVAKSEWEKAEEFANEALEVATALTERVEIAACHRIFAQIAIHREQPESARDWFSKSIDMFKQIDSRYELAVTRYLAATSSLYAENERVALLWLAREYFESEEVSHYVEKVDGELNRQKISLVSRRSANSSQEIVTSDARMLKLLEFADHVAQSDMTVLLTGDTGTGKDMFARYIHNASGRDGEFVTVNAAAIPNSMIESELFGHRKGAFTGASSDRAGLIEQANEGTFYLNEIGDGTPEFQAKLLEVLETRKVRRLGENNLREINFRLIAATNVDLKEFIQANKFRADLYHRLNEIPIALPTLAERPDDIEPLVRHFLKELGCVSYSNGDGDSFDRLVRLFKRYCWPGNVRELYGFVKRYWVKSGGDLSELTRLAAKEMSALELSRENLLAMLESTSWNRRETARRLGIAESTVRNRIKQLDLEEAASVGFDSL